jgi:mRNA-degrading endonuclease YafQ of YafQ-DinJ toxin-antitoxin module
MATLFKKCKLFEKSFEKYKTNNRIVQALKAFVESKSEKPDERFGAKDYKFKGGILGDYYHASLSFDVSVIYQMKREGENTVFLLYGIFSHDDSGTGQPSNTKKMQALVTKLDNQTFN